MKVLFIKDLRGQGKKGDIVEVKDGYAKNFLIKNGYAEQLTDSTLTKYNRECDQKKELDEKTRQEMTKMKVKLEKEKISFQVKTGKDDKVFGSISPKQIRDELEKLGYDIDKKQIEIDHTVSSIGYHDIKINLYKDVVAKIKINLHK